MEGDKGKVFAQSPERTALQAGSDAGFSNRRSAGNGALGEVLEQMEAALETGDVERARRLVGVAKELRALGFGGRDGE